MNKVWAVFLREYLERVRRRSFLIGILLVPVFMAGVIVLPLMLVRVEEGSSSMVQVIDESGRFKRAFEEAIQSELPSGEQRFHFLDEECGVPNGDPGGSLDTGRFTEPDYLASLLEEGVLDWYLLIPANVSEGEEAEFHGRIVSNIMLLEMLEGELTEILRRERLRHLDLDPALLQDLSASVRIRTLQHKRGVTSEAGFESLYFSTMAMVMILFLTITLFGSMIQRSILEDKNQHVTEVVLSSMDATRFFAGKILGIGAVGLTQYLVWMLLALAAALSGHLTGLQAGELPSLQPLTLFYFVLFYILGFLFYAGLFAAIGAMSTTDQEAQQMTQPLIMLLVVPAVIMIYIFQNPDSLASILLSLLPFFSPLVMFMRINISAPPLWQIMTAVALLILSVGVVFVIAGRIFRVGILMTGKRVSLVEAWRWVRQA